MKKLPNQKGFTLVELLVVVSILAILAVISIVVFSNVQKGARDARRKADVDAVSKALESRYVDGSTTPYPAVLDTWFSSGSKPVDPTNSGNYQYSWPSAAAASYTLCEELENATGNYTDNTCTTSSSTNTGQYYGKKSQR